MVEPVHIFTVCEFVDPELTPKEGLQRISEETSFQFLGKKICPWRGFQPDLPTTTHENEDYDGCSYDTTTTRRRMRPI